MHERQIGGTSPGFCESMSTIDRRTFLTGTALALMASAARVDAAPPRRQAPGFYRYKVGTFEVTAIHDGTWQKPIDDKFVRNAPFPDVQKAIAEAFAPPNTLPIPYTSLVINTGTKLVLIDTSTGGQFQSFAPATGTWQANLAAAGIDPRRVDAILVSHFHPDHINGIKTKDNALTFPKAEIFVAAREWIYWMNDANLANAADDVRPQFLNARRIFKDIDKRVTQFDAGRELVHGIIATAAFGHTPGHMAFTVASENESLLVLSDVTNNPYLFARHPDWQPIIDVDGPVAVETRKKMLDRAAADRMLVAGYHFPFPAVGHITRAGAGYDFVPVMWETKS